MSQVDLFTKRVRRRPPASEFAVHCSLADLLDRSLSRGWLWWHTPNGEKRDKATAGRLKRQGVKAGVSDFVLVAPPTACLHVLELKKRGAKPSPEQVDFLARVHLAGGKTAWCDSFDKALATLKEWGAVRVSL